MPALDATSAPLAMEEEPVRWIKPVRIVGASFQFSFDRLFLISLFCRFLRFTWQGLVVNASDEIMSLIPPDLLMLVERLSYFHPAYRTCVSETLLSMLKL
jgi:hypothetical protein